MESFGNLERFCFCCFFCVCWAWWASDEKEWVEGKGGQISCYEGSTQWGAVSHLSLLCPTFRSWVHALTCGGISEQEVFFFLISSLTWPMIQERSYFHITLPNKKLTHLFLISSSWQFVITHGMFSPLWLRFFPFSSDHLHISQIIITYHSTSLIKVHLHLCPLISLPINIKNGFCSFFILNLSVHHTWFQTSIYVF
jgi:hypothetical protein